MKTTIYLVRHAQASGNVDKTFQGHSDNALTQAGYTQLDRLAERFKTVEFDAIYASPLLRTRETAGAANRYHGLELHLDSGLLEINGGDFEGISWDDIPNLYPEQQRAWNEAPHLFCAPGGESMAQVYHRVSETIDRIARENAGKTIVVVSHGCAIRNYLCAANGWGIERLRDVMWSENTAVCKVEYDEAFAPTVVLQNDASHLEPDLCLMMAQNWWQTTVTEEALR